jgi:hypothetical protein
LKKAGLVPAFLPAPFEMPVAACCHWAVFDGAIQQTVDGLHGTLEILSCSSYVPSLPIGVRSQSTGDARPRTRRVTRLEMPLWTK